MVAKRAYVETSVISYLTGKPSVNDLVRAHQRVTADWWDRRAEWDCVVSPITLWEISRGNPEAAAKRLDKARSLIMVPGSTDADALGDLIVARKLIPESKKVDAYHLALAAFHQSDYLVTWNQKHLDNLALRSRIEELIRGWGLIPATVITPERLMEEL